MNSTKDNDFNSFFLTSHQSTFVDLLHYRALHQPKQIAYNFLQEKEAELYNLTYQELDQYSRAIAAYLQHLDISGERALLLYSPGLEFITAFFGCLYAGVVAVPAYPPRNNRNLLALVSIITSSHAKVALTTTLDLSNIRSQLCKNPELAKLRLLATDSFKSDQGYNWQKPVLHKKTLAFLQYTSGSTGTPKGVMISHGNLLQNSALIHDCFGHHSGSHGVIWLPPYHDMGLVGGILQPLYGGFPVTLMSPIDFLQKPLRWLEAISYYKATTSGAPNFAYDLCVRKIKQEQLSSLDLSSWEVAFIGAESIKAETIERFASYFASCGFRKEAFYPCYGMAETTLIVSGGSKTSLPVICSVEREALEQNRVVTASGDGEETQKIVSCGRCLYNHRVFIVDPQTNRKCQPNQVGEIWVSGSSIAQGYWNLEEETQQSFAASLADTNNELFLRTGDLGFLQNRELFVTGRLKDLMIFQGRNYYPQDIELIVERCHPSLRPNCGVAFSIESAGQEKLVIAQEVKRSHLRKLDIIGVIESIRRTVAGRYNLHTYAVLLLRTGSLPKTSSGKIRRRVCRANFIDGNLNIIGSSILENSYSIGSESNLTKEALLAIKPENQLSRLKSYLQEVIARILKLSPSQLDLQQPLSKLGIDSLMAVELKNSIETNFDIKLSIVSLIQSPSIAQLASEVFNKLKVPISSSIPLASVDRNSTKYPLSYGQRSLWFLHQLAPESPAYNIARAARICSKLNVSALQYALQKLVSRHSPLRTTFTSHIGKPVAQIHDRTKICFQIKDASTWSKTLLNSCLVKEAHEPFNLEQGPLLRVTLFVCSAQEYILLLVTHHIVADFWSLTVLVKELGDLYQAKKNNISSNLVLPSLQYIDYAYWQSKMLESQEGEKLWSYWQKQLAGDLPVLNLFTDYPRPPVQTYRGASVPFKLSTKLTEKLKTLSHSQQATLYMTLLAAFQVLLYRYTLQEDFLVGSPTAGRNHAGLAKLVGYFVNMMVLRADLSENPTFEAFLSRTRSCVLQALEHQDYPFALLVERIQPVRDPSRSPLFQVAFVLQKSHLFDEVDLSSFALGETGKRINLGDLTIESLNLEQRIAQFDLTLVMTEADGELLGSFEYNTNLYNTATIERMVEHFQTLLNAIVENSQQKVLNLPLLTLAERRKILVEWNDTQVIYPQNECLHQLFEAQVEKSPDAIALVYENSLITYRELNYRANQLAHYLQKLGVEPEVLVGIFVERSIEMLIGLLGILKAGAAYVPLSPDYPQKRLDYILADSGIELLLTQEHLLSFLPSDIVQVFCLDRDWIILQEYSQKNLDVKLCSDNLAYVIYTSGSTGQPKGVMTTHLGIRNRLLWMQQTYQLADNDRVLQKTPFSFDVSVWEFFWPLMTGASLIIAKPEGHRDSRYLANLVSQQQITTIHFVPSMLQIFLQEPNLEQCSSLRRVFCSGEALSFKLVQRFFTQLECELHNLYGPTEASIDVTFWQCQLQGDLQIIPIGRPIANTKTYILDKHLQPVPIGVPGELHIAGDGLARGYLNRLQLTQEKFIPNPFNNESSERLYKTGDLARYLSNGNIEYLGRLDRQVKIRGFRIELQEIETVLAQYSGVQQVVITAHSDYSSNKYLVAYVVLKQQQNVTVSELRSFLKEQLPSYMVPCAFIFLDTLPMTPNGKVDLRILPKPDEKSFRREKKFVAPRTFVEEQLVKIWIEVLKLKQISIYDNFFYLGGHSLSATQIFSRIEQIFQLEIPLQCIFTTPILADLAKLIEEEARKVNNVMTLSPIKPVSRSKLLPLSFPQRRRWYLEQLNPGSSLSNVPIALRVMGSLNTNVLEDCLNEVIKRHEILRTSFLTIDGQVAQIINPIQSISLPIADLSEIPEWKKEERAKYFIIEKAQQPFCLIKGNLINLFLLRLQEKEHILLLIFDHMVFDGWSGSILLREITALYQAFSAGQPSPLSKLPIQYADFAFWQQKWLQKKDFASYLAYWRTQLGDNLPVVKFPSTRIQSEGRTFKGNICSFTLPSELYNALKDFSRKESVTLFMTLLTAFKALLYSYTGQTDIILGSPIANRIRPETENLIGLFINTLVLRSNLSGNPTLKELLKRIQRTTMEAYSRQHLPFTMLFDELQNLYPQRDFGRDPLFQVMFVLQNYTFPEADLRNAALKIEPIRIDTGISKVDLVLSCTEEKDRLTGVIEYSTDLFDHCTARKIQADFQKLLLTILTVPEKTLSLLPYSLEH